VGVDTDHGAIEWAAWSLRDLAGMGTGIELRHGDLDALPFDDDEFDGAWCASVLGYVADPARALRELVRVVRPGGRVVVISGDAARHTFLPIGPELEARLRDAELWAIRDGVWGTQADIFLGRRLYALATLAGAARITPLTLVWERTSPLRPAEHDYLRRVLDGLAGLAVREYLGSHWEDCRSLLDPDAGGCILHRSDLHVVQTASAVVLTV
jgi:SAM-dependent methyltransferase